MKQLVLGIETSCDDTSMALIQIENNKTEILEVLTLNQDNLLSKWGGVVPELTSREHVMALDILNKQLSSKYKFNEVTHIAVTTHPGLIGPLLTGINVAKTLSLFLEIPIIEVNHLFAHLEAIHLTEKISYPYLGLLVSGGHTAYFLVKNSSDFELLGHTLDDAAGEAFDKGGKMLGLGYPAGRIIDEKGKLGNENFHAFPVSRMNDRPGKLSFSGIKTSLRVYLEKNPVTPENINDVCASYQKAIVDTLIYKLDEIVEKILLKNKKTFDLPIVVGGGVACNSSLREKMKNHYKNSFFVDPLYCADNAAMIAHWASLNLSSSKSFPECLRIEPTSRYIEKSGK